MHLSPSLVRYDGILKHSQEKKVRNTKYDCHEARGRHRFENGVKCTREWGGGTEKMGGCWKWERERGKKDEMKTMLTGKGTEKQLSSEA
jgi:hypothetical protein